MGDTPKVFVRSLVVETSLYVTSFFPMIFQAVGRFIDPIAVELLGSIVVTEAYRITPSCDRSLCPEGSLVL